MSLYYLAYGSNLHPARLEQRLGSVLRIGKAQLCGWQLHFHKRGADGSGKGNLLETAGAVAWGVVYQLEDKQKACLDEFEGDGYDCVNIMVKIADKRYQCFCYLAQVDWIEQSLLPHDWYRDLILYGARHAQSDDDYLQTIQQQPVQADPVGKQRHAQLLKLMQPPN